MAKKPATLQWIVLLCLLWVALPAFSQNASTVFEQVKNSVFVVKTFDADGTYKALGSAVLLPGGKYVTCWHVVEDGTNIKVGRGESFIEVQLYAWDTEKDLALLGFSGEKTIKDSKDAQIGKASTLKVGQPVYAVGAPQGLELSISEGIVSQLRGGPPPIIQTTAAISPGSSGGGLYDSEGHLVGLITLYVKDSQNLNFAVPVEWIDDLKPGAKNKEGKSLLDWAANAAELESKQNWPGLRDYANTWIKAEPNNVMAWENLSFAYYMLHQYKESLEIDLKIVQLAPTRSMGWRNLGDVYEILNQNIEAIKAYKQALRLDPSSEYVWRDLGNIFMKLKQYSDAIAAYKEAIRINPNEAYNHQNAGNAYFQLSKYEDAISAYRQALKIESENAAVWIDIGDSYFLLKKYNDSVEAYRQALRIEPDNVIAWESLGSACVILNRYTEAIEADKQALRINPDSASALSSLGYVYSVQEKYEDAIDAYRRSLLIERENALVWYQLGLTYYESNNKTLALDVVKTLRKLDAKLADDLFDIIVPPLK